MRNLNYTADEFEVTLDAVHFISKYHDFKRFNTFCKECPQYDRNWACPPFSYDIAGRIGCYEKILFHVSKLIPDDNTLPLSLSREFLKPERIRLENKFIELEKKTGGLFLGFAGSCPYCPENSCTRPEGKPCRYPHLCHPSLESYGFDLCRASKEIADIEILWSENERLPRYLTLICGLFFNP